ncbi:hypothetical protein OAC50_00420 [bacterium]|nr:hypothetical protein [bacterium]
MNTKCVKCKGEIHPLRIKALPTTKVCVDCSSTGCYKAVTTTNGTGDHTWNDIEIMTPEQYEDYQKLNGIDDSDTHTITFGIEDTNK